MMGSDSGAGSGGGDRLSGLGDAVLGHVLSFLPAVEAARAAALSRRWRGVFAHVHTVAFEEPEPPIPDYDGYYSYTPGYGPVNRNPGVPTPPAVNTVSAALFGRLRLRPGAGAVAAPLRAIRVAFDKFGGLNAGLVDMWLCYAMRQAGEELHVDLRLRRENVCRRGYSLRRSAAGADKEDGGGEEQLASDGGAYEYDNCNKFGSCGGDEESDGDDGEDGDEVDAASPESEPADDEDEEEEPPPPGMNEYVTPWSLFSCATLRTLRIGPCRLDLPAAISLPSLDTLHLTRVTGRKSSVQRLVSACPRLADLTLESCEKLTELVVLGTRLRRLVLRCCHDLVAVATESSELRAFEYRGAVPAPSLLDLRGGSRKISSCALDFCGAEATDPTELAMLAEFLRPFAGVKSLHLTSARLGGAGLAPALPAFLKLRHLELSGMLPEDDDTATVTAVTTILKRTPSLETLTLFFLEEPEDLEDSDYYQIDEEELLDGHNLKYDRHAPLAVPEVEIPCLRERTKEINLVHYEGNLAQRTLAKFLLRNAPVADEVCGEFAQGPLWIQTRLMEEIKGWVVNKSANMMFF